MQGRSTTKFSGLPGVLASPKQLAAVAFATFLTATASAQPGLGDLLAQADANEDGAISREEFVQARSKQFAGLDTDTSNALSEAEFAVALEGTPMRRFSSRAFSRADKNDDGELTQGEWDALPTRAFDRMDRNDSGQIEIDELPDRES